MAEPVPGAGLVGGDLGGPMSPANRPRQDHNNNQKKVEKKEGEGNVKRGKERWRPHRMTEDYVNLVGDLMYPKTLFGPYGFDPTKGRFPVERISTLGYLTSALRRPTVIEKWTPYEVAVFEAALTLYGKNFHQVHKVVRPKSLFFSNAPPPLLPLSHSPPASHSRAPPAHPPPLAAISD